MAVVLPAHNAARTLVTTCREIQRGLVDDASRDETVRVARELGLQVIEHDHDRGYRAWTRKVLEALPLDRCSNDVVSDNQRLAQTIHFGFRIGEISCPTKYFAEASSIGPQRSVVYGPGVLRTAVDYRLDRMGLRSHPLFQPRAE